MCNPHSQQLLTFVYELMNKNEKCVINTYWHAPNNKQECEEQLIVVDSTFDSSKAFSIIQHIGKFNLCINELSICMDQLKLQFDVETLPCIGRYTIRQRSKNINTHSIELIHDGVNKNNRRYKITPIDLLVSNISKDQLWSFTPHNLPTNPPKQEKFYCLAEVNQLIYLHVNEHPNEKMTIYYSPSTNIISVIVGKKFDAFYDSSENTWWKLIQCIKHIYPSDIVTFSAYTDDIPLTVEITNTLPPDNL